MKGWIKPYTYEYTNKKTNRQIQCIVGTLYCMGGLDLCWTSRVRPLLIIVPYLCAHWHLLSSNYNPYIWRARLKKHFFKVVQAISDSVMQMFLYKSLNRYPVNSHFPFLSDAWEREGSICVKSYVSAAATSQESVPTFSRVTVPLCTSIRQRVWGWGKQVFSGSGMVFIRITLKNAQKVVKKNFWSLNYCSSEDVRDIPQ